uniref:Pre-mRNA-splicing factor SLU7 n=1 Tax=Callorhinchus milii TaxID=7868 RepID=A0A4W3IPF1_CALMI
MAAARADSVSGGVMGLDEPKKMTREDWRKKKELEEQRKLGNAPAEVDEEGKDINPHIPQYISSVPWYIDPSKRPTLKHQRPQFEQQQQFSSIGDWFKKGVKQGAVLTKYRRGACENCGALTHIRKDCVERPRKVGAKFTGSNIAPDEHIQSTFLFDYDGKRDRWNGYDAEEHMRIVEEYAKVDLAKRTLKAQKLQEELASGNNVEYGIFCKKWSFNFFCHCQDKDNNSEDEDEDKYADDVDMPGQNFDSKRRITVRNLRIREDIAKYLRNLDPNSAYYDPKTRAMRENPYSNTGRHPDEVGYAGDNFVRYSGDTVRMAQTQLFAWEAYEKGSEVHLQADPTKLEVLHQSFKVKKEEFEKQQKGSILEKYGGQEHLDAPPRELLLAQTEDYVEYSRHGAVIKGQERAVVQSKYEEDALINNHTVSDITLLFKKRFMHKEKQKEERKKKKKKHRKSHSSDSEADDAKKKEKLKKALIAEEARLKQVEQTLQLDERKRAYNTIYETKEPTEEEMEAFRMKRQRPEDPMASFLGQ